MIEFIDIENAIESHDDSIERYGGESGIRDYNMLESAMKAPVNRLNYETDDIVKLAATYVFHINKNHPFIDGNKRTSATVMELFIKINNYVLTATENELYELILRIADGTLTRDDVEKELVHWIKPI
jgi:death-on-curing protein